MKQRIGIPGLYRRRNRNRKKAAAEADQRGGDDEGAAIPVPTDGQAGAVDPTPTVEITEVPTVEITEVRSGAAAPSTAEEPGAPANEASEAILPMDSGAYFIPIDESLESADSYIGSVEDTRDTRHKSADRRAGVDPNYSPSGVSEVFQSSGADRFDGSPLELKAFEDVAFARVRAKPVYLLRPSPIDDGVQAHHRHCDFLFPNKEELSDVSLGEESATPPDGPGEAFASVRARYYARRGDGPPHRDGRDGPGGPARGADDDEYGAPGTAAAGAGASRPVARRSRSGGPSPSPSFEWFEDVAFARARGRPSPPPPARSPIDDRRASRPARAAARPHGFLVPDRFPNTTEDLSDVSLGPESATLDEVLNLSQTLTSTYVFDLPEKDGDNGTPRPGGTCPPGPEPRGGGVGSGAVASPSDGRHGGGPRGDNGGAAAGATAGCPLLPGMADGVDLCAALRRVLHAFFVSEEDAEAIANGVQAAAVGARDACRRRLEEGLARRRGDRHSA